jgi:CheY-like chemotaxis protein
LVLCYPDSSSWEASLLIKKIKELLPHIPILVIVNNARNRLLEEYLAAGASDYICEPVNSALLDEKIKMLTSQPLNP